jgi:glutamate-1-semialdehyde aminotransferase
MIAAENAQTEIYDYIGGLGNKLRAGLQQAINENGLKGKAMSYGIGSVFHILLGGPNPVEWPEDGNIMAESFRETLELPEVQARLKSGLPTEVVEALRVEMDVRGVQFMGGHGGFVSIAHTEQDIENTVEVFAQSLAVLRKARVL